MERGVGLSSAEDHALYLLGRSNCFGFVLGVSNYPLEMRFTGKVFDGRARQGVTKKGF